MPILLILLTMLSLVYRALDTSRMRRIIARALEPFKPSAILLGCALDTASIVSRSKPSARAIYRALDSSRIASASASASASQVARRSNRIESLH